MKQSLSVLIFLAFISCRKDEIKMEVSACFDMPVATIEKGEILSFINCSENATGYLWDFGDGTGSDSESPDHSYENRGDYVIKLTATNQEFSDTISQTIHVTDRFFTNLNDTTLRANRWGFDNNTINFSIDIDKDTVDDLLVTAHTYYSSFAGSENYVKITPLNG